MSERGKEQMSFQRTELQRRDEAQIDGVAVVGDALVRFNSRMEAAMRQLRAEVAMHYRGARYISPGDAAVAAGQRLRQGRALR